jgi:hypothetical protein
MTIQHYCQQFERMLGHRTAIRDDPATGSRFDNVTSLHIQKICSLMVKQEVFESKTFVQWKLFSI